jgi:hypothetical protein
MPAAIRGAAENASPRSPPHSQSKTKGRRRRAGYPATRRSGAAHAFPGPGRYPTSGATEGHSAAVLVAMIISAPSHRRRAGTDHAVDADRSWSWSRQRSRENEDRLNSSFVSWVVIRQHLQRSFLPKLRCRRSLCSHPIACARQHNGDISTRHCDRTRTARLDGGGPAARHVAHIHSAGNPLHADLAPRARSRCHARRRSTGTQRESACGLAAGATAERIAGGGL